MIYDKVSAKVDLITDKLGEPVDDGIRHAVISFIMLGLSTSGSCEGHLDWGLPYPWVDVDALNSVDSKKENKRCQLIMNSVLDQYSNNEYLYIEDWSNIVTGPAFRVRTLEATSLSHLILLQKEMYNFGCYIIKYES